MDIPDVRSQTTLNCVGAGEWPNTENGGTEVSSEMELAEGTKHDYTQKPGIDGNHLIVQVALILHSGFAVGR